MEGNSDDSEEEEEEEEPEEEQEKDQISSIFEEEGEVEEDKADYDPWRPLRQRRIVSKPSSHDSLLLRGVARWMPRHERCWCTNSRRDS